MKRARVFCIFLVMMWVGCGGKTSTGPSQNMVRFTNATPNWTFVVEVPEAHQQFELAPSTGKTVPLIPDEESVTDFVFTVTRKGETEVSQTGVVSIGQKEVRIDVAPGAGVENFVVYVDGERI